MLGFFVFVTPSAYHSFIYVQDTLISYLHYKKTILCCCSSCSFKGNVNLCENKCTKIYTFKLKIKLKHWLKEIFISTQWLFPGIVKLAILYRNSFLLLSLRNCVITRGFFLIRIKICTPLFVMQEPLTQLRLDYFTKLKLWICCFYYLVCFTKL